MPRAARSLAVLVSAVLGIAGGVAAGVALGHDDYPDPLGLDAPLINQPCQANEALLVLANSDNASGLGSDVAAYPDARYLETANSCDTAWRDESKDTQAYTAYLGPMTRFSACAQQMTGEHVGDRVTMLESGTTELVQCLCYVSNLGAPKLRLNQDMDARQIVYLRALQQLLTSMGRRPDVPRTDVYSSDTAEEVKQFQQYVGHAPTGTLDAQTWKRLQGRGCNGSS